MTPSWLVIRWSAWLGILLCLLAIISLSGQSMAQGHINITWMSNSTSSFPTADFPAYLVPYYEKRGTMIYWKMRHGVCEYKRVTRRARGILEEHLAKTGPNQDVAIMLDVWSMDEANCVTVVQVSGFLGQLA